ncbi:MAG: alternate F1F0 ATPase, F1 subunit alpha [Deltaproteobacteria bacterium]|nr:alternate F1F0 ATPase, F1 subunit alpha [Deltaproteobacteria bacterium]
MNVNKERDNSGLDLILESTIAALTASIENGKPTIDLQEVGSIVSVGQGVARISGLTRVKADELAMFPGDKLGVVFNADAREAGVVLLDDDQSLHAGCEVNHTGRVLEVPVGNELIGRVIDAMGRPLDQQGNVNASVLWPVERDAPSIMDRDPVVVPLQTGIKVVDALIPVGRGQRELILGDRQTGKTAIAIDTIINQRGKDVICIYCAIGKQSASVAKIVNDLRNYSAMDYTIVMVTTAEEAPGLQFVAPYAATTMGEYFMEQGRDVLVVFDDLTGHARAYREISLLLRRPPGREAYPGDIFYIHSRLLERSTHLRKELGGGSLTAFPIAETEAQNIAGYIPTNLISITDGQIYLSPHLFQKGVLPAIDVGKSVSRVGGKSQLTAYRSVAGDLRLSYSQFEELEAFSRFGTRLDEQTRKTLERGRRVREVLKQGQSEPISVPEQLSVLLAVNAGIFDEIPVKAVTAAEKAIREKVGEEAPRLCNRICQDQPLTSADRDLILELAASAIQSMRV